MFIASVKPQVSHPYNNIDSITDLKKDTFSVLSRPLRHWQDRPVAAAHVRPMRILTSRVESALSACVKIILATYAATDANPRIVVEEVSLDS